jgi:hypothetical protein
MSSSAIACVVQRVRRHAAPQRLAASCNEWNLRRHPLRQLVPQSLLARPLCEEEVADVTIADHVVLALDAQPARLADRLLGLQLFQVGY